MPLKVHRTWAEVNLDNIAHNFNKIKGLVSEKTKIMGVVKADAYGHGFFEVAKVLMECGVDNLGVAFLDEAKQLRRAFVNIPILVLSYCDVASAIDFVDFNITPTIFDFNFAKALSDAAVFRNKTAKIHIKIDTGMSRLGFVYNENDLTNQNTINEIEKIASLPNIEIEGIFSHFAVADEEDKTFTLLQFERFKRLNKKLSEIGINIKIKHICNSSAVINYPDMHLDMVRAGIALYGFYSSKYVKDIGLIPSMELKTVVTQIKEIEKGETVSYGRTFLADKKLKIATIPIGYADGYSRLLSNKAKVIAGDKICNLIGRICMDQCMIDVTCVNNINVSDEVIIFGNKNGNNICVEQIAELMGTINYEVLCVIGKRVPRVYIHNGQIVEVLNYLETELVR